MRLVEHLDKGASLGADAPCLVTGDEVLTYGQVQQRSHDVAAALARSGIEPGDKVAILSANDPVAFSCVFGISRAGAVWCPVNPRNEARENRELLALFDCTCLVFQASFAPLVAAIKDDLPQLRVLVCLDGDVPGAQRFAEWVGDEHHVTEVEPPDDVAMLVGTGGTTGRPKGVVLTGHNLEAMTALTLMSYPFAPRPVYLALAPLTHAAGVLCFPVLALGGQVVIMTDARRRRVPRAGRAPPRDAHVPAADADLHAARARGARHDGSVVVAVLLVRRGADVAGAAGGGDRADRPGDGPAVRPDRGADDDLDDGAGRPLPAGRQHRPRPPGSAGRPTPLVTVGIMTPDGELLPPGERGEIVVRGSLVMAGYHRDPEATAEASRFGWHHTGDVGYLDDDGFLFIVDRAKDMIITGGFNVYSVEVEQALLEHPDVQDCAVVGLPDEKWGERVTAVVQAQPGRTVDVDALREFVKERIGSVKTPKQITVWDELPRSKVGKVLKAEIKQGLGDGSA